MYNHIDNEQSFQSIGNIEMANFRKLCKQSGSVGSFIRRKILASRNE